MTARTVGLQGKGRGATTINPASATGVALRYTSTEASWRAIAIADAQHSRHRNAAGHRFQNRPRCIFCQCRICRVVQIIRARQVRQSRIVPSNGLSAISGMWVDNECQFETSDYHILLAAITIQVPVMRCTAGNICCPRHSHLCSMPAKPASISKVPLAGTGQFTYDNCIFEANPGWVLYMRRDEQQLGGQPGIYVQVMLERGELHNRSKRDGRRGVPATPRFCAKLTDTT